MSYDYDVAVIGSGPSGFSCAIQAAKLGKRVLIIEKELDAFGGTWVNTGTMPSKAFKEAAKTIFNYHSQFGDERGRKPFEKFHMEELLAYKQDILESMHRKIKKDLIKNGIDTLRGTGSVADAHRVEVVDASGDHHTVSAEYILLSTGSRMQPPSGFEIDHETILDYRSILQINHIPRRLAIVGGSISAFEYATTFAALGTRVTLLVDKEELLPFLDAKIKDHLIKFLESSTIQVFTQARIDHVRKNSLRNCTEVGFRLGDDPDRLRISEVEQVLFAGGMKPNTEGLGLENVGIRTDESGYIRVNEVHCTDVPSIYATGDVIGKTSFASLSFVQGRQAACSMFGVPTPRMSATDIPYAIYSIPEIAAIGLTEQQAVEQGQDVEVGICKFSKLTQADLTRKEYGLLKLIFERGSLRILGIHIIGDQAADLVHLGQSVMALGGTIRYFVDQTLNYPSYSEAYRLAAFNGLNKLEKAGVEAVG